MKTITGRPAPGSNVGDAGSSGVQTLSDRQSSLCGSDASGSDGLVMPGTAADCGAIGPKVDASRTSPQRLGLQRGAPTQRADRCAAVGDARERPQVLSPDTPESSLSDGHDTLHVRGPYGRRAESVNRSVDRTDTRTEGELAARNSDRTRTKGCRICHHAAITLLRRGCSELSGHCPQAGTSRLDVLVAGVLGALLSSAAAAPDATATTSTTLPGPAPNQSQINATQSQVSQIEATLAQEEQQTSILDDKYNTAQQDVQNAQTALQAIAANLVHCHVDRRRRQAAGDERRRSRPMCTARPSPGSRPTSPRRPT